jgi:MerR family transcriptional regulator/heat shock protein HspR
MDDRPRYTISVAAELTGVHPQTLRAYEARGLVSPRRTPGGTRRYSERDIEKLNRITQLTSEQGLSLLGAIRVLEMEAQIAELIGHVQTLERKLVEAEAELRSEIDRVHRSYRRDLVLYRPPAHPTRRV